jgi:hypothetical protein
MFEPNRTTIRPPCVVRHECEFSVGLCTIWSVAGGACRGCAAGHEVFGRPAEKTVNTRMFYARRRLSELLAAKDIYTTCS